MLFAIFADSLFSEFLLQNTKGAVFGYKQDILRNEMQRSLEYRLSLDFAKQMGFIRYLYKYYDAEIQLSDQRMIESLKNIRNLHWRRGSWVFPPFNVGVTHFILNFKRNNCSQIIVSRGEASRVYEEVTGAAFISQIMAKIYAGREHEKS